MTVYVLMGLNDYEPSLLYGVYSTRELAEAARDASGRIHDGWLIHSKTIDGAPVAHYMEG